MDDNPAKVMKYVNTGEVRFGGTDTLLNSGAIGSCVVITVYDSLKNIGAMAHVMLPGENSVNNKFNDTRYAVNSIDKLLCHFKTIGTKIENIEICLVGGANVLKREKDSIGQDNIDSIEKILCEKQMEIKVKAVGGFERRTVLFDIMKGCIYYTVGDSKQKILWQTVNKLVK